MSFNYNHTVLVGRIVRDPEVKRSATMVRAAFSLAVDRPFKKTDGSFETDFIPIVFFGKMAEQVEKYLKKGQPALVEGRIQIRDYEKDGQKQRFTEIAGERFQLLMSSQANG